MIDAIFGVGLVLSVFGWVTTPAALIANDIKAFKCLAVMTVIANVGTISWALQFGKL